MSILLIILTLSIIIKFWFTVRNSLPGAYCPLPTHICVLKNLKLRLTLIALVSSSFLYAQVYPVQVTPQIVPPYDLKLASYATAATEKLFINLLLTDITEQGRQVRLKMYIEGQGFNIQNPDFVAGASPILLDGGVNLRLSNLDLQSYFSLNNLQGITAQQYNQPLPDGLYNFCFEVYDFNTGRLISQKSCISAFLVLNDPPILNVPGKNELVLAQLPQNVVFTWTPRHLNATNVEYEFILKEIWDNGMDPRAAFQSSPIFQQISTQSTTLLYGPSEVQMIEGKTYAWQVRALVNDGISEASIFRNNGYSEIFWFNYTRECLPPAYVLSEAKSSQSVLISWQNMEHVRFDVQYRKFGSTSEEDWFSQNSYSDQVILHNLEPGTKYQFRVGGECTAGKGFSYSQIRNFTTPTNDEEAYYNCGVVPTIEISNYDPLPDLNIGEVFTAGDFPVTVKAIRGSNGVFSGWGFIVVPYLGDTKIKVAFDNINVNTDYQLTQGIVETDYDAEWENVDFVDELTEILEGDNDIKEISVDFDITEDDIVVNEDGSITVKDPNSDISIDYAGGDDVVIKDKSGDVFHVDEDGNITKGGVEAEGGSVNNVSTDGFSSNGEVSAITAPGIKVTFISGNYTYGYDEIPAGEKNTLRNVYKHVSDSEGHDYFFVHKAVKNGRTDQIKAKVEILDDDISIDDLVIKTKQGEEINYSVQGEEITLDLKGHYSFENEEILATIQPKEGTTDKQTIAGSFTLWHLSEKEANVTIVPVNGKSLPSASSIQESLNNIYGKAMVKLNVSVAPSFEVETTTITMDNSGALANYTADQQAIIRDYKTKGPYNPDSYYLFVFGSDIQPSISQVAGFMPIGRQFGFVFSDNLQGEEGGKTSLAGTMAHELGHGIFGLSHPFDQYGTTKKNTPWLMDYAPNGLSFSHMDWSQIHNPDLKFYVFQDEDEGAHYDPTYSDIWAANLLNIMCARNKGQSSVEVSIDYSVSKSEVTYGKRGGVRFKINDIEIDIQVDELPKVGTYVLDIGSKKTSTSNGDILYSYTLSGTDKKMSFKVDDSNSSTFSSWLTSPPQSLFKSLADQVASSEGNEAYSALTRLPECAYNLISATNRVKYINWMVSGEWVTNEHQEELIIRLLEEVPKNQNEELIEKLESYNDWEGLFESFDNVSTHQGLFRAIMKLYQSHYSVEELDNIQAVFDFNMLNHTSSLLDYTSVVEVSYETNQLNFTRKISKASWTPYGLQNVQQSFTNHAELGLFDPVLVIVNDDHKNLGLQPGTELKSLPAILAAFFIEKKNSEYNKQLASTGLDIALLAVGVGEVSAAIKAYQAARTVRTLFRLTLAVSDFVVSFTDVACQSDDSQLCNEWREISFYIQIGLLTVNAADGLESLIRRTNKVTNPWMDDIYYSQKETIEKYKGGTISAAKRQAKGVFGEMGTDLFFIQKQYEPLHIRNATILDGWGESGIDHIFKKDGKYYIVESKFRGYAKLSQTADGLQMSKGWIEGSNRLPNVVGIETAEDIIDSNYQRILSEVAPDGTVTLSSLDEDGKIIGIFNP